jgi:hypothetical protein
MLRLYKKKRDKVKSLIPVHGGAPPEQEETFASFCKRLDTFFIYNEKITVPEVELEAQRAFFLILYGLLNAESCKMDSPDLLGVSELLGKSIDSEDLNMYFTFSDDSCNHFSYSIPSVMYLCSMFLIEKDILERIMDRKQVSDAVKAELVRICKDRIDSKFLIRIAIEGFAFGVKLFEILSAYILSEKDNADYSFIDSMLKKKMVVVYGKHDMKKFLTCLNGNERDCIVFVICILLLKEKVEFLTAYLRSERNISILQNIIFWLCDPFHVKRLKFVAGTDIDILAYIVRVIVSLSLYKNLAEQKQINFLLNDFVYFTDKMPVDIRAKAFSVGVATIYTRKNDPLMVNECFNMLFAVTEDLFMSKVAENLNLHPVLHLFDKLLVNMFKKDNSGMPMGMPVKNVKGKMLVLLREETVQLLENDPDVNMDNDDMDSLPNQLLRTLDFIEDGDVAQRLRRTISTGSKLPALMKKVEEPMIDDLEDIFGKKGLYLTGGDGSF